MTKHPVSGIIVARALVRAASRLVSTLALNCHHTRTSVEISLDAARTSACATIFALTVCLLLSGNSAFASDKKLTEDDRIEILRGMMAEFATVKSSLPRSPKPLPFESTGTWDKQKWAEAAQKFGPAARVGDQVQITKVTIEGDKILFEINGGMKGKGHWYDHVQVGMGGSTQPVSTQQNTNAPSGTNIALLFNQPLPALKAADIKKMLAPVLNFDKETATENYVEKLPEPVQKAIKENKAIEGMDRDQVILSLGKPRHKERNVTGDGVETEDWIYGEPPGKITFITFANSKVIRIKESYADLGGSTAPRLPVK